MRTLLEFYDMVRDFAEAHTMINEFGVLGNEEELAGMEFNYRSMQLLVSKANISRALNAPSYTMEFSIIILDKTIEDDDRAELMAAEENMFVISQFQDYLIQQDATVDFEDIDFVTIEGDDHNIVTAYSTFIVTFERFNHNSGVAILDYEVPNNGGGGGTTPPTPTGLSFVNVGQYVAGYDFNIIKERFPIYIENITSDYLNKVMFIDIVGIDSTTYQLQHTVSSSNVYYSSIARDFVFTQGVPPSGECSVSIYFKDEVGALYGDSYSRPTGCVFIPNISLAIAETQQSAELFFGGTAIPSIDLKSNTLNYSVYATSSSDVNVVLKPLSEHYDGLHTSLDLLAVASNYSFLGGTTSTVEVGLPSASVGDGKDRLKVSYLVYEVVAPLFSGGTLSISSAYVDVDRNTMYFLTNPSRVVSVDGTDYTIEGYWPLDFHSALVNTQANGASINVKDIDTGYSLLFSGSSTIELLLVEDYGSGTIIESVMQSSNNINTGFLLIGASINDPYEASISFLLNNASTIVSFKLYIGINGKYYDIPNDWPNSQEFNYIV
jgi:hypothetical protein